MDDSPVRLSADNIKHLEMIQAVITRLAGNSFLVKGATVTITAALLGLAVSSARWQFGLVALGVVIAFWGLDCYYLRAERLFRALFDVVRSDPGSVTAFYMGATGKRFIGCLDEKVRRACTRRRTFFSGTLLGFYLVLAMAVGAGTVVLHEHRPSVGGGQARNAPIHSAH